MSPAQHMSDDDEKFIAEPKLGFDRRRHPREPAHLNALVVDETGRTSPCIIMDHSQSGFRIRLLSTDHLADRFGLIDLLGGVGHEGTLSGMRDRRSGRYRMHSLIFGLNKAVSV